MRRFYTTGSRNFLFFTALWRGWWSRGGQSCAWCLVQHYSRLTTINCRFIRLLVILSVFLLSCKASSPLTELGIVHTHPWLYVAMIYSGLESKIPLARILKQVYVTVCIWQFQFQRETLCIGNAVSHKCVLAFITTVDLSEWMLWRDCDNSALSIIWILSKKTCWLPVEAWRSFKCGVRCLYLLLLDVHCDQCKRWFCFVFFETVPTSEAQLFYYLNIFLNVFTRGHFVKLTAPGCLCAIRRENEPDFISNHLLSVKHYYTDAVFLFLGSSHILFVVCNARQLYRL